VKFTEFEKTFDLIKKLRDPKDGCPWDLEQTHQSLLKFLLEETYEYMDAVESEKVDKIEDELGDLLLQILLHSAIGEENNSFTLESVSKILGEKIIRRHPHVFEKNAKKVTSSEVKKNWRKIKHSEQGDQKQPMFNNSILRFPGLVSAIKIGKKTEVIGFDWENPTQVIYKIEEEWQELKEELNPSGLYNRDRVKEEMGDFLFTIAQLARHLQIDPEESIRSANKKFISRFSKMEQLILDDNKTPSEMSQLEMDKYWGIVKENEREH
jgi:MazG family protein